METYQKTKRFTLRLRQDQIDKLKEIASVERETSAAVLRGFIEKYKLPEGVRPTPNKDDLQQGV